jgi:hypothetical protein
MVDVSTTRLDALRRRGLLLEYATISWNVLEAVVAAAESATTTGRVGS